MVVTTAETCSHFFVELHAIHSEEEEKEEEEDMRTTVAIVMTAVKEVEVAEVKSEASPLVPEEGVGLIWVG